MRWAVCFCLVGTLSSAPHAVQNERAEMAWIPRYECGDEERIFGDVRALL